MDKIDKESGQDWSHYEGDESYSCGSPGSVDPRERTELVQRPEGQGLPNVWPV